MLKILLLIFIIIPLGIWLGTTIASFVSIILMTIAVAIGGFVHRLFRGKKSQQWDAPEWLGLAQMLIIQGLIYGVIANVIGQSFNWGWLTTIGGVLTGVATTVLVIDLLILVCLSTIHGRFELME